MVCDHYRRENCFDDHFTMTTLCFPQQYDGAVVSKRSDHENHGIRLLKKREITKHDVLVHDSTLLQCRYICVRKKSCEAEMDIHLGLSLGILTGLALEAEPK